MRRKEPVNRVTIGGPTLLRGGHSIGHSFRIVRMCSKVLFAAVLISNYSSRFHERSDIQIERSIEPDAMCWAVGSNRVAKTSPECPSRTLLLAHVYR